MLKQQEIADCRKCGTSTGWFTANFVTMTGDYHTVLCQDCRNDFHLYIESHPTWKEYFATAVKSSILAARTSGDGVDRTEEMTAIEQHLYDLKSELFHVSKAWVLGEQAE